MRTRVDDDAQMGLIEEFGARSGLVETTESAGS